MSAGLRLTIATPAALLVDVDNVRSLRAEDMSGSFGVLPGHADLLTVLPASVLRWTRDDEPTRPVRVPRLSPRILNDTSRIIHVELPKSDLPGRDPRLKLITS